VTDTRDLRLPSHLQSAKLAFADLTDAFGGQVAAAAETGKSQPRISAYAHPNTADFPPLDVIDALEARTVGSASWPQVTGWLARRRGCALVRLPDPSAPPMPLTQLVAETVKTSAGLTAGILAVLTDAGDVSAPDAWRLLKDAGDLVRMAVEVEAMLKARAAEGRGG
jgi:hypothetical protein